LGHQEDQGEAPTVSEPGGTDPEQGSPAPLLSSDDLFFDGALEGAELDEFDRAQVAARIAELACSASVPVNIGLFGPWGSGKSSMATLIEDALAHRDGSAPRVKLIRYDAWKYGGHSLRRNFISNAATQLGISPEDRDGHRFHRGLYENHRRVELDAGSFARNVVPIGARFLILFILFLIAAEIAIKIGSLIGSDISGNATALKGSVLLGGALATFAVAAVGTIFDSGSVQIDQNRPSDDEEFSDAFLSLLARASATLPDRGFSRHLAAYRHWRLDPKRDLFAKLRRWWHGTTEQEQREQWERRYPGFEKIVFFIDELDRCAEEDVVATLGALRTFLDEGPCAFIVAADRDVLERALKLKAEQATPINENTPYYSLAAAFLDKIFQHQISLPPLRTRRLTAFARESVRQRERGIWLELREAGLIEQVLPALIPSHVQSPRRVKVLLNNFATTARIAQSRVQWPERAAEIAKLTALQTEFPHFAAALASDSRLTRLMLCDESELPEDPKIKAVVARFSAPGAGETFLSEEPDERDEQENEDRWQAMNVRQRENLRRYLHGTDQIAGPQSDLIYLEAAGAAYGLADPVLGDRIANDAADVPAEVAREIREREADEQSKAIELLGEVLPDGIGRQRQNVLRVLLETAELLEADEELVERAALAAAKATTFYLTEEGELEEPLLAGALRVALASGDDQLADRIVEDERIYASDPDLLALAEVYERLPEKARGEIEAQIAERWPNAPELLTETMVSVPENDAIGLFDAIYESGSIAEMLGSADEQQAERARALVERLIDGALGRSETGCPLLDTVLDRLITFNSAIVADAFSARVETIRNATPDDGRWNRYVLRLWSRADSGDWQRWCDELADDAALEDSSLAEDLLCNLFEGFRTAEDSVQTGFARMIEAAIGRLTWNKEPMALNPVIARLGPALADPWWTSEAVARTREVLYKSVRMLIEREPDRDEELGGLLAQDLERGLGEAGADVNDAVDRVQALAAGLGAEQLKAIAAAIPEPGTVIEPAQGKTVDVSRVLRARAVLAALARDKGDAEFKTGPFAIKVDLVIEVTQLDGDGRESAVAAWLALSPTMPQVRKVLLARRYGPGAPLREAVGKWNASLSRKDRTSLLVALMSAKRDCSVIDVIADGEFEEAVAVARAESLMRSGRTSKEERKRLAMQAAALSPQTPSGQKALADLIAWLLGQGRRNPPASDIDVTIAVVRGLGDRHQSKRRLDGLFAKAAPRAPRRLTDREIADFQRAGLAVPKDMVRKSMRGRIFNRVRS
jgi:hypothetical protein